MAFWFGLPSKTRIVVPKPKVDTNITLMRNIWYNDLLAKECTQSTSEYEASCTSY
jgi:hypothetical protein